MTGDTRSALLRAFIIAILMAAVMMLMAFGFIYLTNTFKETGNASLPVSSAIVLLFFALSFIVSAVLLDRNGVGQTTSLIGGAAVALALTVCIISVVCGLYYLPKMPYNEIWELLLTGFALALVASVIINQLTLKL